MIEAGEKPIEFEKVPSVNRFLFLRDTSGRDARELGKQVGDFLHKLHAKGVWQSRILGCPIYMW